MFALLKIESKNFSLINKYNIIFNLIILSIVPSGIVLADNQCLESFKLQPYIYWDTVKEITKEPPMIRLLMQDGRKKINQFLINELIKLEIPVRKDRLEDLLSDNSAILSPLLSSAKMESLFDELYRLLNGGVRVKDNENKYYPASSDRYRNFAKLNFRIHDEFKKSSNFTNEPLKDLISKLEDIFMYNLHIGSEANFEFYKKLALINESFKKNQDNINKLISSNDDLGPFLKNLQQIFETVYDDPKLSKYRKAASDLLDKNTELIEKRESIYRDLAESTFDWIHENYPENATKFVEFSEDKSKLIIKPVDDPKDEFQRSVNELYQLNKGRPLVYSPEESYRSPNYEPLKRKLELDSNINNNGIKNPIYFDVTDASMLTYLKGLLLVVKEKSSAQKKVPESFSDLKFKMSKFGNENEFFALELLIDSVVSKLEEDNKKYPSKNIRSLSALIDFFTSRNYNLKELWLGQDYLNLTSEAFKELLTTSFPGSIRGSPSLSSEVIFIGNDLYNTYYEIRLTSLNQIWTNQQFIEALFPKYQALVKALLEVEELKKNNH